jgi:hypothetical protein
MATIPPRSYINALRNTVTPPLSALWPLTRRSSLLLLLEDWPAAKGAWNYLASWASRVAPQKACMQRTSQAGRIVQAMDDEPIVSLDRDVTAKRVGAQTLPIRQRPILHLKWNKEAPHDAR